MKRRTAGSLALRRQARDAITDFYALGAALMIKRVALMPDEEVQALTDRTIDKSAALRLLITPILKKKGGRR